MSERFNVDVLAWGKRAFEQDPSLDFDGLVRALPGVHPDDVRRTLGNLQASGQHKSPQRIQGLHVESLRGLPAPHPLDYDWRFSTATVRELAGRASVLTPRCGAIALLGIPSLFGELREKRPDARLMLADRSAPSVDAVASIFKSEQLIVCDLLSTSLPSVSADVVIADPPWYPEFFDAFTWAAARMIPIGGHLLLCGPNHGTRPGATTEWEQIGRYAESLGFELSGVREPLRYDTPPFEFNALGAAGHPRMSSDWRTGLLSTFRRIRTSAATRRVSQCDPTEWEEHMVDGVRWRVRRKVKQERVSPVLRELVAGDILNSVSRRDLRRTHVDLWSSGNRVLGCADTYAASLILHALATGASPVTYVEHSLGRQLNRVERDAVQASGRRLKTIIEVEQEEYLRSLETLSVS